MKKYLLAALVVLSTSSFAAVVDNVTVFGGLNLDGEKLTMEKAIQKLVILQG